MHSYIASKRFPGHPGFKEILRWAANGRKILGDENGRIKRK